MNGIAIKSAHTVKLSALLFAVTIGAAQAASQTWNTTSTSANWSDTGNWSGAAAPGNTSSGATSTTDTATFNSAPITADGGASATPVVINTVGTTIGSINYGSSAGAFFIGSTAGNTLYLSSGGSISNVAGTAAIETINAPLVIAGANGTYTFSSNSSTAADVLNFGGAISGGTAGNTVLTLNGTNTGANTISGIISNGTSTTFGITASGGEWVLTNANTYSGGTAVSSGTLLLGNATGAGTGTITLSGGTFGSTSAAVAISNTIVAAAGTTSTLQGAGVLTLNGVLTGSGTLTVGSIGVALGDAAANASNAIGYGSFTGALNIGGVLAFNGGGNSNSYFYNLSNAAVTLTSGGSTQWNSSGGSSGTAYLNFGSLSSSSGSGTLTGPNGATNNTKGVVYTVGTLNTSTTYSGVINNAVNQLGTALVKAGTGTLTLTGTNAYTGGTFMKGGMLQIGNGTTGSLSSSTAVTFQDTSTLNYQGLTASSSTQTLGALTFSGGAGTPEATYGGTGTTQLTFASLTARTAGATGNFVTTGSGSTVGAAGVAGNTIINFTTAPTAGFQNQGEFFNGANYAYYDTAGATAFMRGINYGTDANSATASSSITSLSTSNVELTASIAGQTTGTAISTLNMQGFSLGLAGTFTTNGILDSGGSSSTISGGTSLSTTTASTDLVINTNLSTDNLTIGTAIINNGTTALTKTGSGTLTLTGTNTYSGTTYVDQGALAISGANTGNGAYIVNNNGTLNVSGTITSTAATTFIVGNTSGNGVLNLNSGAVVTANSNGVGLIISNSTNGANTGSGVVNINSGATFSTNGDIAVGLGGDQSGILNIAAGATINEGVGVLRWFKVGQYDNSNGIVNMAGGTLNLDFNSDIRFAANGSGGTSVFNQNGGNVTVWSGNATGTTGSASDGAVDLDDASGTGNYTYNLNSGTLTVNRVFSTTNTGTRAFNFNGGTLKAFSASAASFFNLGTGNVTANVRNNGGTIDNNGFNITIAQPLVHSTLSGDNATDGGMVFQDSGAAATTTLSGSNTYNGGTTINSGTVTLGIANALAGATGVVNVNGGALSLGSLTSAATLGGSVTLTSGTIAAGGSGSSLVATSYATQRGSVTAVLGGSGGLTQSTSGTTTLSAANTYSGATSVTGGSLALTGSGSINGSSGISINGSGASLIQTSSVAVTNAITVTQGTLYGTGTVGAVTLANTTSAVISNGNNAGSTGILTVGSLTFNGVGTIDALAPGTTTAASSIIDQGSLTVAGTGIVINASNAVWTNGTTYDLLNFASTNAVLGDFTLGTTNFATGQSGVLALTGTELTLTVNGDSPRWTGLDNGNWQVGSTGSNDNWKFVTAGTPTNYVDGAAVLFDDSAAGTTSVLINAATVNPASVTFNNSTLTYTVNGSFGIGGGANIIKNGTGTVTMATANSYSGSTAINAGVYNLQNSSALGNTSLVTVANNAVLQLQGGISVTGANTTITGSGPSGAGAIENVSGSNSYAGNIVLGGNTTIGSDSGTLTLSNTGTMTGSGDNLTLAGAGNGSLAEIIATGAGSLTKSGTGTWTVSGANTFTGGTTLNGGTLIMGNASALGASTNTLAFGASSNATLELNGNSLTVPSLNSDSTATIENGGTGTSTLTDNNTANGTDTFSGNLVNGPTGTLALTKNGTGTLVLAGLNSFSGATTLSAGGITYTGTSSMSSNSNITVGSGATLALNSASTATFTPGAISGAGNVQISGGTINVNNTSGTVTLAGTTQVGINSTLNVTGLNGSILNLAAAGDTGGGGTENLNVASGVTLQLGSWTSGLYSNTVNDTLEFSGAGNTVVNGSISIATANRGIGLLFAQTGTVTLLGSGTNLRNNSNGGSNLPVTLNSGTVDFNTNNAIFNSGGTIVFNINGGTIDNTSSSAVSLAGNHTTTIGGSFSYGGTNNLSLGTNAVALGVSTATITVNGTSTLTVGGAISGTGDGITEAGVGFLDLAAANGYTGTTTVTGSSTLVLGIANALNSASVLTVNGSAATAKLGTFNQTVSGVHLVNGAIFGTGTLTDTTNFDVENGTISAPLAGSVSLVKTASGTVSLTGTNFYTGGTTVNQGVLTDNGTGSFGTGGLTINPNVATGSASDNATVNVTTGLASGTSVTVNSETGDSGFGLGTLNLNGTAQAIGDLSGNGSVVLNNGGGTALTLGDNNSTTFSGVISDASGGSSSVTMGVVSGSNTGTQTLSGVNTYTGATAVLSGNLAIGVNNAINSSSNLTVNGGSFQIGAFSETVSGVHLLGGAITGSTGTLTDLDGGGFDLQQGTVSAILAGSNGMIKTGSSTVTLSGANVVTGIDAIDAGTLALSGAGTLGDTGNEVDISGGALDLGGTTQSVAYVQLFGSATIQSTGGTGTLNVGSSELYVNPSTGNTIASGVVVNGPTEVSGGAALTDSGALTGTVTVDSGGTLAVSSTGGFGSTADLINNGQVSMNNDPTVGELNGAGTLTLNNALLVVDNGGTYSGLIKDGASSGSLTLAGGTLTLSHADTYTGATTITGGQLNVTGSLASGSAVSVTAGTLHVSGTVGGTVNVANGAFLNGTGTTGAVTLAGGGSINLQNGSIGTLTVGGLTMGDGTTASALTFDIGSTLSSIDSINDTSFLTMLGTNGTTITIGNATGVSSLAAGLYNLITYSGTETGSLANLNLLTTSLDGKTLSLVQGSGVIELQVSSAAIAAAFFNGQGTDLNTAANYDTDGTSNTAASVAPGATTNVSFSANRNTSATANVSSALTVNSLAFGVGTGTNNETITASGTGSITIEATNANGNTAGNGITVNSGSDTISAPVVLGASQTWTTTGASSLTQSGLVSDAGLGYGLTKAGTGTLVLSNATGNTYSGGTTVNAGTLIVSNTSNSATGSGVLNVNGGATLGGHGISSGTSFNISGTGTATGSRANILVGMNSPASINTTQVLTLLGSGTSTITNANLTFNLNAGVAGSYNSDPAGSGTQLSVGGTAITFGSGQGSVQFALNLQNEPAIVAGYTPYVLIAGTLNTGGTGVNGSQYSGLTLGTTLVNSGGVTETVITGNNLQLAFGSAIDQSYYGTNSYLVLYQSSGVDDIDVVVVPEPSTWALIIGGFAALVFWQRRRSKNER